MASLEKLSPKLNVTDDTVVRKEAERQSEKRQIKSGGRGGEREEEPSDSRT